MNHSCKPNVAFEGRVGSEYRFFIVTLRVVEEGEELLVDYGQGYWVGMAEKGFYCACGEKVCRYGEKKMRGRSRDGVV
jgi:SET domain-containing protein